MKFTGEHCTAIFLWIVLKFEGMSNELMGLSQRWNYLKKTTWCNAMEIFMQINAHQAVELSSFKEQNRELLTCFRWTTGKQGEHHMNECF